MPTARALRVCPDLYLLPHTSGLYARMSRQMFDLCEHVTPVVQRNSIDEGYLDLGPCGLTSPAEIEASVRGLQEQIWGELQVPVSMGIAANKLVAQIASKLRKPHGFVVVLPGTEAEFLAPLPIGKLPGVGTKTEAALVAKGLKRVGDVFTRSESELAALLGRDWREFLAMAHGEDNRPVETDHVDAKSYSQQETFAADIGDFATIVQVAKRMIDDLLPKIRADGKRVKTITLKVRYGDFSQTAHTQSLAAPTDFEAPFYPLVNPLLRAAWTKPRPLRLISVRFSGVDEDVTQLEMFTEAEDKRRRLAAVLDQLNARGGESVVRHGHQLAKKITPR